MTITPKMLAVRKRLFDDFDFYAANSLYIRTKEQSIQPLVLNRAQKHLLRMIDAQLERRGYVRIIVLKGRQMGLSTVIGGWLYWWVSQRQGQKAIVVAHKAESTQTLFDMTRRFHEKMPDILKPSTRYSSRKELVFDKLDSSYTVVTAGGDGIGRSETITAAHMSEGAFWPKSIAKENRSGLLDTIPMVPGTAVFEESTANGMSGTFYESWKLAESGESDFECCFCPWYWDDGYCLEVPEGFERSPRETELIARFGDDGLTDGHLVFRRRRIGEKGEELFRQEYPLDPDEAFLTSGRPVFHPEQIQGMLRAARDPIALKTLAGVVDEKGRRSLQWEDNPIGELRCYLPHDPQETYYIGADVGAGVQRDFSVAQVFDSARRQAAVWRGQVDPDFFGTTIAHLGRFYNDALICCERNNHGILTNRVIHKDEDYANVYQETSYDKVTDVETVHIGFFTSEKSKPLVIDKLRANVRTTAIEIYDRTTLREMQGFIVTETGRMEAEKGTHDDCVIALALADHINAGAWVPIKNEASWLVHIE